MSSKEKQQSIALAAIFQAADLVSQLAKTGQAEKEPMTPLIESILMLNAESTEDIYGGSWDCQSNLALGRRITRLALGKDRNSINPDTIRYALSLIHLEGKLAKAPELLEKIGLTIKQIEQKKGLYDTVLHDNLLASISGMYQDTLSTLPFRIQVQGDSRHLQQPHVANPVRSVLMAGIRAAMLWRQLGGKRWHLIFKRKRILAALDER
ncbi:high frequency lysogenization protein HflD [Marinomonas epiphytica]